MQRLSRIGMILLVLFLAASASPAENSSLPLVVANDNRTPAGELKNGVLNLRLELRPGRWYPEDEGGGYRDVYAFAEEGHAPQSSGPLIRAPQGTQIHATIHNTLPLPAKIYGLHRHPGDAKGALRLGPGETRELQFLAGEPGTYLILIVCTTVSVLLEMMVLKCHRCQPLQQSNRVVMATGPFLRKERFGQTYPSRAIRFSVLLESRSAERKFEA